MCGQPIRSVLPKRHIINGWNTASTSSHLAAQLGLQAWYYTNGSILISANIQLLDVSILFWKLKTFKTFVIVYKKDYTGSSFLPGGYPEKGKGEGTGKLEMLSCSVEGKEFVSVMF